MRHDVVANSLHVLGQIPLGQQALAMLLTKDPPWEWRFVAEIGELDGADLEGRMTAIDLAAKQGAKFDCEVVGIVAGRLARSDRAKAGRQRSEERRVGKGCGSTCRPLWSPDH